MSIISGPVRKTTQFINYDQVKELLNSNGNSIRYEKQSQKNVSKKVLPSSSMMNNQSCSEKIQQFTLKRQRHSSNASSSHSRSSSRSGRSTSRDGCGGNSSSDESGSKFDSQPRSSKLATIFCVYKLLIKSNSLLREAEMSVMNDVIRSKATTEQASDLLKFIKEIMASNTQKYDMCKKWLEILKQKTDNNENSSEIQLIHKKIPLIIPEIETQINKFKSKLLLFNSQIGKGLDIQVTGA
jgi:hypothetical protein